MQIRQLEYFVAVARERHFARAAAACYVSQPALSESLHKLENELGVPLIRRGRSFEGLTPEGERLVGWARRVLSDHDQMVSEARSLRVGLSGHLRIGVAPSASTTVAALVARFWTEHPLTTVSLETKLSTGEMVRRLRAFELDAAVCYPLADTEDIVGIPVYRERPVLVASETLLGGRPELVTWQEAATYPLVMLDRTMRCRAVVDGTFAAAGLEPVVVVETDSVATLYTLVLEGAWAGIVPDRWHWAYPPGAEIHTAGITDPVVETPILLARLDGEPVSPLLQALESTALALSAERIAAPPAIVAPRRSPLPS